VQRLTTVTTSAVNSSALHFLESRGIKEERQGGRRREAKRKERRKI
jgi:hypothetical protein